MTPAVVLMSIAAQKLIEFDQARWWEIGKRLRALRIAVKFSVEAAKIPLRQWARPEIGFHTAGNPSDSEIAGPR